MVRSDLPPPTRPRNPGAIALEMVRTPRFAFFTDQRGVVYCEAVHHTIVVMSCLGHTMGGQPTQYTDVVQWRADEGMFLDELKNLLDRGFTIERDQAYMMPNIWGTVQVIKEVTDLKVGSKLRKICREATPEAFSAGMEIELDRIVARDLINPKAQPVQPFTDFVLGKLKGQSVQHLLDLGKV